MSDQKYPVPIMGYKETMEFYDDQIAAINKSIAEKKELVAHIYNNEAKKYLHWQERQGIATPRINRKWHNEWSQKISVSVGLQQDIDKLTLLQSERESTLQRMARKVEFINDPDAHHVAKRAFLAKYKAHRYGKKFPHRYARAELLPLRKFLSLKGIDTNVEYVNNLEAYDLWVDCEPWMVDAATHLIDLSFISRAIGRSLNLRVIYPFLSVQTGKLHRLGKL